MAKAERARGDPDAPMELMYFAYRGFVALPDRVLATRGLARAHHRILFFVARLGRPTVGELQRTLAVTKQALNAPLRDLRRQALIAWHGDAADARLRRLSLTRAGRALERKLSLLQRRQFAAIFAAGSAADEAGWRAVMRRLADAERERAARD